MKYSKLVLVVSVLFFLGYSCKPKPTKEIKVENQIIEKVQEVITYGLYFPEQDSISVNLNLNEYKTYEELLERFKQISCSDRIPKITIENDSILKKIYFASYCDRNTTPILKNKNVIEIYDDKIYRGYDEELLPLDSANTYVERNLKNFGKKEYLSESPDKLFFVINYDSKSKISKLEGNLLKLTKVFDEVGGNNRLNVLLMQLAPTAPPPPAPEKIEITESKTKVKTPKKVIEIIEDEVVFETVISSTETDEEIVEVSEVKDVEETSKYEIIEEYYTSYSHTSPRKLKSVGAYDENGERTGLWKQYSSKGNGYLASKGYFKNGKRVGHWIYYYSNGYKKAEGKLTGKLDPKYSYDKWLKTGTWIRYGEYSGRKNAEYYYDDNGISTGNKWGFN